jgi:PAS domain S-box-containing protein
MSSESSTAGQFSTDITERERVEEALRRSEARYRALAEASSQAVWAQGPAPGSGGDYPSTRWWEEVTGQSIEEQANLGWIDRVHPDDRERVRTAWSSAMETGNPYQIEYRLLARDGGLRVVLARAVPVRGPEGEIWEWVGTLADVTERHHAETALRETAERLSLAFAAADLGDWSWDAGTDVVTLSPRAAEMLGLAELQTTWVRLREQLHVDDRDRASLAVERAVAARDEYEIEYRVLGDGEMRWILAKGKAQQAEDGRIRRMIGVMQDVTARKRVEEDLREADRRKNEFLAMLAHELRNPLAPLRNAAHVLGLVAPGDPVVENARGLIERQVSHMARLLEDLLDVSRISRGKILLRTEPLDLVQVVREAAEDHRSLLEARGLTLRLELPDGPVRISGDRTRLSQVMGNLLQNARKFTNPQGSVTVRLAVGEGEARVEVEDTGIGLEPEVLDRLFEPFSQADRSLDRTRGGLGLGLALVKRLIELHGGGVEASSAGSGQGSCFTLRLPLQPEVAAAPDSLAAPDSAPQEPAAARKLRLLLVEDNPDVAEGLALMLQLSGHEVTLAATGSEGLAVARDLRPDLALCDIGLPGGMDGYDLARALRASEETAGIRLIALSGYGQEEDKRLARDAGFDQHLTKPVDPLILLELLEGDLFSPTR